MNEYNTKITRMGVIPTPTVDGKKLSNTSAICNDGETAYILRTCGSSSDNKKYPFAISMRVMSPRANNLPEMRALAVRDEASIFGRSGLKKSSRRAARRFFS